MNKTGKSQEIGLFSWSSPDVFHDKESFLKTIQKNGITSLYQGFSRTVEKEALKDFVKSMKKENIKVYWLAGTPEWSLASKRESLLSYIDEVIQTNKSLPKSSRLQGIVLDIEPYLLPTWESEAKVIMSSYVESMKEAYDRISQSKLELILCIPYHFDTTGFEQEVEELIAYGCDTVAVMNYFKEKEQEHLFTEMSFAKKHKKNIIQIYELKKPGTHDLTDKTSYYQEGVQAVQQSFDRLSEYYSYDKFYFAYHDYKALKEVANHE